MVLFGIGGVRRASIPFLSAEPSGDALYQAQGNCNQR
jgi:hypothetical protein